MSGAPRVSDLLQRVKRQALAAQQHQDIPFEQIVENTRPVRSLAHTPLFQVMFTWQNTPQGKLEFPLEVKPLASAPRLMAKFDLTLSLRQKEERIVGGIEYASSLFNSSTIERHSGQFRTLLQAMVANDAEIIDRLLLLTDQERQCVLYEWNDTAVEYPGEQCVHELFEMQVCRTPQAVAVVSAEGELTYAELNRQANQLAHYLRTLGVSPDQRAAICVDRGMAMMIGLLAILKAGGAYVPMDPAYPAERLSYMLKDSAPVALLTQADLLPHFDLNPSLPVIDLMAEAQPWNSQPESNPTPAAVGLTCRHLAYVIYTSGSTGMPKGVMIEHRNLSNYLRWSDRAYYQQAGGGSPAVHSIGFDGLVTTLYGPLLAGQRLVLLSPGEEMNALAGQCCRGADPYTLIKVTPSHLKLFNQMVAEEGACAPTQILMIGGEALVPGDVAFWQKHFPGVRLVNHFGPTEITVGCCTCEITEPVGEAHSIPIGKPIANTRIYILDGQQQPVPVGVTGELYVAGAGVARGYLNRPELTAERFLKDPFTSDTQARMYRTGDLGRWLGDGRIEFQGRNDYQVKIRGFRIELGEIEARLAEHAEVGEAVVMAREDGAAGDKRLVAYYTAARTEVSEAQPAGVQREAEGEGAGEEEKVAAAITAEQLRMHLAAQLPDYMVPAAYVRLERMPLTANGKLDRKALPAPEADAYAVRGYQEPVGEIETKLAAIWAEVLKLERVGRHDNFFELGGHSLLAVRVVGRVRQALNINLAMVDLFTRPVLASLAEQIINVQLEQFDSEDLGSALKLMRNP
jgi:amino acid adenylation domain-containing protein